MYTFETRVRYSECGAEEYAGTAAIFDYMQDTCTFQSEELGIGVDYMKAHQCAWILNSWQADISRYPKFGEKIKISTWPYDFHGFYGFRNFKIENTQGEILVCANSVWVFMDLKKGRPAKIAQEITAAYSMHERLDMEYTDRRIADFEAEEVFPAVCIPDHFIDTNHHMNNTKYILLAEEMLPSKFCASRIRVEYRKAAVCGDIVYPCMLRQQGRISAAVNDRDNKPYAIVEFYK